METTHNEFQVEQPDMILTNDAKYYLNTAARWATFIAVIAFIGTGFLVLAALIMLISGGATLSQMGQEGSNPIVSVLGAMGGGIMAIIYFLIAVFYFFYAYYLFRFASSTKKALLFNSTEEITKCFGNLKSFFKLWGIMTIVAIALGILLVVAGVIFAFSMASAMH